MAYDLYPLAVAIVAGFVDHCSLIETMETLSKAALCALVLAAVKVMADPWVRRNRGTLRAELSS